MLAEAQFAFENERSLRTVEDRAFYCMYHAAIELLHRLDLSPRSQSGTIALFGRHVVHERGIMDKRYYSMLSKYQAKRQEADYEVVFLDDREDAELFLKDAEDFLRTAKESADGL